MSALLHTLHSDASEASHQPALTSQDFDFEEYFLGHTYASGWFADRFGNIRFHFSGNFFGHHSDGAFLLDESLRHDDGHVDEKQWRVTVSDEKVFRAESPSLIGGAMGQITGSTLCMKYTMKVRIEEGKFWNLNMQDKMILQPDGILHNTTQVCKWGVRIGTVSAQYHRKNGNQLLTSPEMRARSSQATPKVRLLSESNSL